MLTRRQLLRAAGGGALAAVAGCARRAELAGAADALPAPADRKLIVVVFGGGTRSSEAVDDVTDIFLWR